MSSEQLMKRMRLSKAVASNLGLDKINMLLTDKSRMLSVLALNLIDIGVS